MPLYRWCHRLLDALTRLLQAAAIALLGVMTLVVFADVAARMTTRQSLTWAGELATYCFVWLVFVGAAIALRRGNHLGVGVLVERLPLAVQRAVKLAGSAGVALLLAILIAQGPSLVRVAMLQQSPAMNVSTAWLYASAPVMLGAMLVIVVGQIVETIFEDVPRGPSAPTQAEG